MDLAVCHGGYLCQLTEATKGRPATFRWSSRFLSITATSAGVAVSGQSGLLTSVALGDLVEVLGEACEVHEWLKAPQDRQDAKLVVQDVRKALSGMDVV